MREVTPERGMDAKRLKEIRGDPRRVQLPRLAGAGERDPPARAERRDRLQ